MKPEAIKKLEQGENLVRISREIKCKQGVLLGRAPFVIHPCKLGRNKQDTARRYLSVEVESQQPSLIDQMKAKIDAPQGKQIYAGRRAIVEPVFANIRVQKRLDHFTLRSKAKVDVQWKIFALVHNIGKIHHYRRGQ